MSKEQQELLGEAHENYKKEIIRQRQIQKEEVARLRSQGKRVRVSLIELLTQEEFINKCKTDAEFSENWGLKIEERELGLKERAYAYNNSLEKQNYNPKWQSKIKDIDKLSEGELMTILQSLPGPTKLITITYNDKTIESYE